jgi:DNA-binding response OmpR family regulator
MSADQLSGLIPKADEAVHVLHIEDDDAWAGLVNVWLTHRGLKVLHLRSCAEMRAYLSRSTSLPQCVLLDLTLRDGDGLDLCDEIKSSPVLQHLPIVVLSGRVMTPQQCLKHEALYRVAKGTDTEEELSAVLKSVLAQNERARGVVDAGDLRLDPRGRKVIHKGKEAAVLQPGQFSALLALIQAAPKPVSENHLYEVFLERPPHKKTDPELSIHLTVRNYVSRLRGLLGPALAERIAYIQGQGYVYRAPTRRYI